MIVDPKSTSVSEFHGYLLGSVAPRPIGFASTVDQRGRVNLSPFSFFNAFSANPPILIFSPALRVRNKTPKHSLENVLEHPEVVINIVNYAMVQQMSLSSTEYDKGVNEFIKSGFTQVPSQMVKPPRVGEAPVAFECKVKNVIPLGEEGGAGNLVISEIVLAHIKDEILDGSGKIDPAKLDPVARLGGDWYTRVKDQLFMVPKPQRKKGIGVDKIPSKIRKSNIFDGNDQGILGNVETLPSDSEVKEFEDSAEVQEVLMRFKNDPESLEDQLFLKAKEFISAGEVDKAWKILLMVLKD